MSKLPQPKIRMLEGRTFVTEEECEVWAFYRKDAFGSEMRLTCKVGAGFQSDGASIPRWAWWLIGTPTDAEFLVPALVHDWFCNKAQSWDDRLLGDAIFFRLLKRNDVPRWKRSVMLIAVLCYGRWVWRATRGLRGLLSPR